MFILNWFLKTDFWVWLARHVIAHFTFRVFGYPKFPMQRYFEIEQTVKEDPSAVYAFVAADKDSLAWKLTHFVTGARWGHAGIVKVEEGTVWIYHMKGNGLNRWHLLDLLRESDSFALIKLPIEDRPEFWRRFEVLNKLRLKYDFQLKLSPEFVNWLHLQSPLPLESGEEQLNMYCSEYVYVLGAGLVQDKDFKPHWSLGASSFEPDQIYNSGSVSFEHAR